MNQETKLGLFVLVGIIGLVISIVLLGDFQFQGTYTVNILFDNVTGLPSKAKVKIAGVEVGGVKKITLKEGKAKVKVWIKQNVKIHKDAKARIVSTGIIGSKFLELTEGSADAPLLKKGEIIYGDKPMSFEDLAQEAMDQLNKIVSSFTGPQGKSLGKNLGETIENVKAISISLRKAIVEQEQKLSEIVSNFHTFSEDMAYITTNNRDKIGEAIDSINKMAVRLDRIVEKVEKGEGTLGKLMSDDEMGEDLKSTFTDLKETTKEAKKVLKRINLIETEWDYRLRYDGKYERFKYDVGLRVWPRENKYYYVGASNVGDKPDSVVDPEEGPTIDFKIGKVFKPYLTVYAGAIRSKGGIGVKVKPLWKWEPMRRLELTAEGYQFSRVDPVQKPKVNVGGNIKVTDWADFGAQVEDIYYESNVNSYMHLKFQDEDIAYVLGLIGLAN